jgi:hypothetical protein
MNLNFKLFLYTLTAIICFSACQDAPVIKQELPIKAAGKVRVAAAVIQRDSFCIAAVGDIMLGTSYPDKRTLPANSAKSSFKNVLNELKNADVTFGNLEGTLLDTGAPAYFKMHQLTKGWQFRMPVSYGKVIKDAGFNVLSLGNNHSNDFGDNGRNSTTKTLDSLGINYGGLLTHPSSIFEIKGVTYGFCAFSPNSQTLSLLDYKNATAIIQDLKQLCDIVIISFHGGGEGVFYEHVPCMNESYGSEKRGDVHKFAHNAIDAGADIILGNGPHLCRALEIYKNRLIAYSLGNFCTYRCVSVAGVCGYAPLLKVYVNKKGEFLSGQIISAIQDHQKGLELDTLNRAAKRIQLLTKTDFEQPGLSIGETGKLTHTPL